HTPAPAVPYPAGRANLLGGLLKATATYTGGRTHVGPVHGAVTGTVPLNAGLLFCGDGTISAVRRCSGSNTPCTSDATCGAGQACSDGEACDPVAVPTGCVATSTCGADRRCRPQCDDGNSVDGDGCTACHVDMGCRITGGGFINGITDPFTMAEIVRAHFGGQVGAPCGCIGCFDQSGHVQGNWTHNRKNHKGGLK